MREIDALDLLPHVVQHHAAVESERPQMRRQQRKIVRRQGCQKPVEAPVLELPGKRGCAVRHRGRSCQNGDAFSISQTKGSSDRLAPNLHR
jgi:hypothetical protein